MCRWNQLDLVIVLLSIMGITLEKIEEASLPINPTIIRIMRVLRIARGKKHPLYHTCVAGLSGGGGVTRWQRDGCDGDAGTKD